MFYRLGKLARLDALEMGHLNNFGIDACALQVSIVNMHMLHLIFRADVCMRSFLVEFVHVWSADLIHGPVMISAKPCNCALTCNLMLLFNRLACRHTWALHCSV